MNETLTTIGGIIGIAAGAFTVTPKGLRLLARGLVWMLAAEFVFRREHTELKERVDAHAKDRKAHRAPVNPPADDSVEP